MNFFKLTRGLCSILVSAIFASSVTSSYAEVVIIGQQNFESGSLPTDPGWGFGSQSGGTISVSKDKSLNYNGSAGSIKATYPNTPGDMYVWGGVDVGALNLQDVYVEFWAKLPTAKKHGVKFLKVFGQRSGTNYANSTFALDYTGVDIGAMYCVGFGDGTTVENDVQNVILFDSTYPNYVGRSYGKAVVSTPQKKMWASSSWGTDWHHFRFRVKFNSGTTKATEVADGAYYVEIDDKVYVDAKNIFNRHYSNLPIQKIQFFDWSQGANGPFELWYDDIKITTGGFDDRKPAPPTQPKLIIK